VRIDLPPESAARCLARTGFCFCFAPLYHGSTKRVQEIRKQLGFRTIFNFLGPLANPGEVGIQLVGVSSKEMLHAMASALRSLGVRRAFVVCGDDGLDEITLSGRTAVVEIRDGSLMDGELTPDRLGLPSYPLVALLGGSREKNVAAANAVLAGTAGAHLDLAAANAGAALFLAGRAESLPDAVKGAKDLLVSGKARRKLEEIREESLRS
jgi:anthranilate phosphoribosyltransferase